MRRARPGRHVAERAPQPWRARNTGALIGTACVVLVATGGVVSSGNGKQAHHLMALGPHNIDPGAGPVTTTLPPATTTTAHDNYPASARCLVHIACSGGRRRRVRHAGDGGPVRPPARRRPDAGPGAGR